MTDHPAVGVVVPNKNGAAYLADNLESIVGQDYPHIECIVMDGESTDGSWEIAQRYAGKVAWHSQKDSCAAEAINRGWRSLSTPIIAWLNSDDMWAPGAVRRAVDVFDADRGAGVVSGECAVIDEDGAPVGYWPTGPFDLERSALRADHILNQPAVFMRRDAVERIGWLRESWLHDHDLWLRLGLNERFVHLNEVLALGRDRSGNLGQMASLVAPLRIEIVEEFLSRSDIPIEFAARKREGMCWANLRAARVYAASSGGGPTALHYLARAVACDPVEAGSAGVHFVAKAGVRATKIVGKKMLRRGDG